MPDAQTERILVIGIGNEFRRDDGVGIAVARRLKSELGESAIVLEQSGEGTDLMNAWEKVAHVIVIDAVSSGAKPGTIHRFSLDDAPNFNTAFRGSTHAFGLSEAIALSRQLNRLPEQLLILGVEGTDFSEGLGFSPSVYMAVDVVVQEVCETLKPPMLRQS